ncbi:hypothetical protein LCGC14_3100570, partial [marine sediment metagenome]
FKGDVKAIKQMVKYNRQDIVILEFVFNKLMPFIKNYALNMSMFLKGARCVNPTCGSEDIQWRGWSYTRVGKYRRLVCNVCGAWGDERKAFNENKIEVK